MRRTLLLASAGLVAAVSFGSPAMARPEVSAPPVLAVCAAELQGTGGNIRQELLDQLADYAIRDPGDVGPADRAAVRTRLEAEVPACVQLSDGVAPMALADRIEIIARAHPLYGPEATRQVLEGCTPPLSAEALVALWRPAPSPFRLGRCGQSVDAVRGVTPTVRVRISTLLINNQPPATPSTALDAPTGPRLEIRGVFETRSGSDWGLGTRIVGGSGGPEVKIVEAEADELFGGSASLEFGVGGMGASIRLTGSYGSGSSEGTFSAPAGGTDLFGHTFLSDIGSGSSPNTGLFSGNSRAVTGRAEQEVTQTQASALYWFPAYGSAWRTRWGVGAAGEWYDESGEAEVAFTGSSSGSSPILNFARYELEARTIEAQFAVRTETRVSDFFIAGTATLGLQFRRTEGEVNQTVTCPPCSSSLQSTSLSESHEEDEVGVAGEIGIELAYPFGPITLTADVALRLNTGVTSLEMPDSPTEQPARFEDRTVVQRQLRFGARYTF